MDDLTGLGNARGQETCARAEQLTDLIDELTSLRVPDRRLDAEIAALLAEGTDDQYDYLGAIANIYDLPELTDNCDAALALVPETAVFRLVRTEHGAYQFVMGPPDWMVEFPGVGGWPAVAVLIAVLRSVLAKEGV